MSSNIAIIIMSTSAGHSSIVMRPPLPGVLTGKGPSPGTSASNSKITGSRLRFEWSSPFSLSNSPSDGLVRACGSLLQADACDSTSSSRSKVRTQVDQVDDDPWSFVSSSQNDENESGEKVRNSRRSMHSLELHWSTATPSTPSQVSFVRQ